MFQDNIEEIKEIINLDDSTESTLEDSDNLENKFEALIPNIVKLREGDHRNHVLRLTGRTRELIKKKITDLTTFFIKQKLNLLRYLRPMNPSIIKEVLTCLDQIKAKTIEVDLNLKGYKAPKKILSQMINDEIRSSSILKFGNHEIGDENQVFFAISTKQFKNFDFEKKKLQPEQRQNNREFMIKSTNKFLQFSHK